MTGDLIAFIRARLDEDEQAARASHYEGQRWLSEEEGVSRWPDDEPVHMADRKADARHIVRHDPARVLRGVEAKRRIVDEHAPILNSVEWPHDQTGKGEAWICRRCANAENDQDNWRPAIGQAGTFPHENFVTSYVLAPCPTLRLLASEYSDHPDYRPEWTPSA